MYVYVCVARRVRVADPPTNRGAGRNRSRAAGRSGARGRGGGGASGRRGAAGRGDSEDEAPFQSYGDPDNDESPIPPSVSRVTGFQLPGHFTRGSLATANSFFKHFFY